MTAIRTLARSGLKGIALPLQASLGWLSQYGPRPPHFTGAYGTREQAIAAVPAAGRVGFDLDIATEGSLAQMSEIHCADYPALFWLARLLRPGMTVLDAGGHLATKRRAFGRLLDLSQVSWVVLDLPAVVRRGRALQAEGLLAGVRFEDEPAACPAPDLLLASGLLQYLDIPFPELLDRLPKRPEAILLNKVAMWSGAEVVTLQRVGRAHVPYRIRNRATFERELAALGLRQLDDWTIPELSHRIATHPGLGASLSRGYCLAA